MVPHKNRSKPPRKNATSPILFLDTNGIHYLRLSASLLKEQDGTIIDMDINRFNDIVKNADIQKPSAGHYENGFYIGNYLARRVREDEARIQYAPVSGFELLCGCLRGGAIVNAASGGAPGRWYGRLDEAELLHYLGPDDFEKHYSGCLNMPELFQGQLGFNIQEANVRDLARAFDLSKSILEATLLELGDCLVYASAMLARAEAIITCDGHLANVIRWVHNPGCAPPEFGQQFKRANRIIQERLETILEVPQLGASLPKVLKIKDIKNEPAGGTH